MLPYTLKKSLGQHFLHDTQLCKKIVAQLQVTPGDSILEIGPGAGALTRYLMEIPDIQFLAFEVDPEKVAFLHKQFPASQTKVVLQDVLKAPYPFIGKCSIIGNFPYNISSGILFKILEWEEQVMQMVGMFQKEVAQRIATGAGSKQYGILSVLLQTFFEVNYLFDVHENCFTPPPKVKSGVIRMVNTGNPYGIEDKRKYINLVKKSFGQRRKTLRNALKGFIASEHNNHPFMDKRAEQLSVADFVTLYKLL